MLSSAYALGESLWACSSIGGRVLGQGVQFLVGAVATEEGGRWDRIEC